MAFQKKTWIDRLTEFATRRIITNATTREETLVEVARAEGEIYEPGDAFNAETMNDLEDRINDAFEEVGKGVGVVDTYDNVMGMISRGEIEEETFVSITDDSDDDSIPAIAIDFDNTNSGMAATEVQGAIDELKDGQDALDSSLTKHKNEYKETVYTVYETSTVSGSYASGAVLGTFSNIPKGIYRVLQIGAVSQYGGYLAVVSGTIKSINSDGVESAAITAGYVHDFPTIKIESNTATIKITSPSGLTYYGYYVMLEKKANVE